MRFRDLPGFVAHTLRIQTQLRSTSGVIGYSLLARLFLKKFWTLSVWEDEAALRAFVTQAPHFTAMGDLQGKVMKARFVRWRIHGFEYPPEWSEALGR